MKLLALMTVVAVSGVAHAQDVRLMAPDTVVRQQLLDERPSFPAAIALLSAGGLLGTAGTGASVFGLLMMAMSGGSLYSGIALGIGILFAVPGAVALIIGVVMMVKGTQKLRGHIMANDLIETVPHWHGTHVRPESSPMVALVEF